MSRLSDMAMPGGWTMSMAWMRTSGQTWGAAEASFVGMWVVMMVAMMLPSLVPILWSYRRDIGRSAQSLTWELMVLVGIGYFFVWSLCGAVIFPLGAVLASLEMGDPSLARAVPIAAAAVVLIAGLTQFTRWKAYHLACCREGYAHGYRLTTDAGKAWVHGTRLGFHCVCECSGLTIILLVIGIMNLYAMVYVTAAITAERLAPNGVRVAQVIGGAIIGAGLFLMTRAVTAF
jgi:predicted metal-binding membrane protein